MARRTRSADNRRDAQAAACPEPEGVGRGRMAMLRWRPGVRLVLILVVLLPMLSTALLAGSRLTSGWAFRHQARLVADDAAQLQAVTSARAQLISVFLPLYAVSYAAGLGITTTALDTLLQPAVPFGEQLARATASIAEFPHFASPTLRDDVTELRAVSLEVAANTVTDAEVTSFVLAMAANIDALWNQTYDQLRADISAWRSPGSFGLDASTLTQTYGAFVSGIELAEGTLLVLQGGDTDASKELIQADGIYRVAISQFTDRLSPRAHAA